MSSIEELTILIKEKEEQLKKKQEELENMPPGHEERVPLRQELAAVRQELAAVRQELAALRQKENLLLQFGMDTLSQAIEELKISTEYAIPPPALDRVQKSLFALYSGEQGQMSVDDVDDDESSRYHCVGFFFGEPDKAVTADQYISEHEVGEFVDAYSPFYNRFFQMEVMQRDKKLDVAVLRRTNVTVGDDLGKTYLEKHAGMVKEGRKVALCSCSVHITMELEETNPALTVLDATVNRYSHSKQHIVYQCPTFGGDCGSALVMHDGKVLGLHVMGVNQLKERIGQKKTTKERLDALEMSMDSAIKCVAHGAIAVVLDKFA